MTREQIIEMRGNPAPTIHPYVGNIIKCLLGYDPNVVLLRALENLNPDQKAALDSITVEEMKKVIKILTDEGLPDLMAHWRQIVSGIMRRVISKERLMAINPERDEWVY